MDKIDINSCTMKDLKRCISSLVIENAKLRTEKENLNSRIADLECMLICKQHQYQEAVRNGKFI